MGFAGNGPEAVDRTTVIIKRDACHDGSGYRMTARSGSKCSSRAVGRAVPVLRKIAVRPFRRAYCVRS